MPPASESPALAAEYETVDTLQALNRLVTRARKARHIAVDTETVIDADSPVKVDPLRSTMVGISIALAPGEAYYLPLRHRAPSAAQGDLLFGGPALVDASGDRSPTDAPEDRGLEMGGDDVTGAAGAADEGTPAAPAADGAVTGEGRDGDTVDTGGEPPAAGAAKKKPA